MAQEQVNPQTLDTVTQTNFIVLADAPATAMGALYQSLSQSLGLAMFNGTTAQGGNQQVLLAVAGTAAAKIIQMAPS